MVVVISNDERIMMVIKDDANDCDDNDTDDGLIIQTW